MSGSRTALVILWFKITWNKEPVSNHVDSVEYPRPGDHWIRITHCMLPASWRGCPPPPFYKECPLAPTPKAAEGVFQPHSCCKGCPPPLHVVEVVSWPLHAAEGSALPPSPNTRRECPPCTPAPCFRACPWTQGWCCDVFPLEQCPCLHWRQWLCSVVMWIEHFSVLGSFSTVD